MNYVDFIYVSYRETPCTLWVLIRAFRFQLSCHSCNGIFFSNNRGQLFFFYQAQ